MPPPGTDPKTGRFEGGGRVIFVFLDDITSYELKHMSSFKNYGFEGVKRVRWCAELTLEVRDVAVLLKNGLFWSEDNIDWTKNYFVDGDDAPDLGSEWIDPRNCHGRYYELIDTEPAQWHGTLAVRARAITTLREFRPSQLSLAKVQYVSAENCHGQTVYHFDSVGSDRCFNAILDDSPLKGWWPWPKEDIDDASKQQDMDADKIEDAIDDASKQQDMDADNIEDAIDDASKQQDMDADKIEDAIDDASKQQDMDADNIEDTIDLDSLRDELDAEAECQDPDLIWDL